MLFPPPSPPPPRRNFFWPFPTLQVRRSKKSKLMRQILLKYIYICIRSLMYKIKLVFTISIFAIKITFKKLSKMLFIVPKKLLLSSKFSNFCTSLSSLFPFLGHCWFYRRSWLMINSKVYGITSLNWILKTQIL